MNQEEKNKKGMQRGEVDAQFRNTVDELADAVLGELEEGFDSELETFEAYSTRLRREIHENMGVFRDSFLRGYEVLLEELSLQYRGSAKLEGKPPSNAIKL